MPAGKTYTAFFYGTLLHPSILRRVIGHQGADLEICPALLLVSLHLNAGLTFLHLYRFLMPVVCCLYCRNIPGTKCKYGTSPAERARIDVVTACVPQHADYPGVIPYEKSRQLVGKDLPPADRTVRGTLVRGLNDSDVRLLDTFEGDVSLLSSMKPNPRIADYFRYRNTFA